MADVRHRTMIGGQAVIEGVTMRGVRVSSLAVRRPDGTIYLDTWENATVRDRYPILKLPVLRGVVNFAEMLIYGFKTLTVSAEIAEPGDEKEADGRMREAAPGADAVEEKPRNASSGGKTLPLLSLLLGVALAVVLFAVVPAWVTKLTVGVFQLRLSGIARTLIEGLVRIAIFLGYIAAVSAVKDMQRVFEYHGAEHKSIYCYEHGEELTVENARKFTRLHPRCGTSFLLIVLIVSILVFSFVTWKSLYVRILLKILLLPLVVGISYEIIRFAGRHDNSFMRFLLAPGLWLQHLTTREPDDSQLEVAIRSLKAVLTENREDDRW